MLQDFPERRAILGKEAILPLIHMIVAFENSVYVKLCKYTLCIYVKSCKVQITNKSVAYMNVQ